VSLAATVNVMKTSFLHRERLPLVVSYHGRMPFDGRAAP
jgi:hypothetical protein